MGAIEQTLQIYYQGKLVAERILDEGTEWLEGISWIDPLTGVDMTDKILDRARWYQKVFDFKKQYNVSRETDSTTYGGTLYF